MLLIENADIYAPQPLGRASILAAAGRIEKIGRIDGAALARQVECDVLDARGAIAVPGIVDPHIHLTGGSGEMGFASAGGPISARELLENGTTTVVGTIGTDTSTKSLPGLLAKVKALRTEGLNAWMWTGGYDARCITGRIREDIIFIEEVIGAGEIAVADRRGPQFSDGELARLAADCHVGGLLTGKAGILHLHMGEGREKMSVIERLLERDIPPSALYPTHVNRNASLLADAAPMTRRGVAVDFDTVDGNLADSLRAFDGDETLLTLSTDGPIGPVCAILSELRDVVRSGLMPLERILPFATSNAARLLKLEGAGEIAAGKRADVLLLERETLELRAVVAGGKVVVR